MSQGERTHAASACPQSNSTAGLSAAARMVRELFFRRRPHDPRRRCARKARGYFHRRAPNQGGKCGVGQLVMTRRSPHSAVQMTSPGSFPPRGGSGRLRDPRLPDLCLGVVSERHGGGGGGLGLGGGGFGGFSGSMDTPNPACLRPAAGAVRREDQIQPRQRLRLPSHSAPQRSRGIARAF
jgi:hypothetical protein